VAYVTCSPHLAETRLIVADVMKRRTDAEQLDARDAVRAGVLPAAQQDLDLGPGPAVQPGPHVHGPDAQHISLLRKLPAPSAAPTTPAEPATAEPTEEGTPTA